MTNYFLKLMYSSSSCRIDKQNYSNTIATKKYKNKTIKHVTVVKLKSQQKQKSVRIVLHFLFFHFFFSKHFLVLLFSFFSIFFPIFTGLASIFFSVFNLFFWVFFLFFCCFFFLPGQSLIICLFLLCSPSTSVTYYFKLYISFSCNLCH